MEIKSATRRWNEMNLRGRVARSTRRAHIPENGGSNPPLAICDKEKIIREVQNLLEELENPWIMFNTPKRLRLRLTINQYLAILSVCDELNAVKRDMDEFGKELEKIEKGVEELREEIEGFNEMINGVDKG